MSDTILMKVQDKKKIDGECTIKGYEKEIELLSYSHSVSMPMTGEPTNTKRTSGTANVSEITISKYLDKGSPALNQYCCEGSDLGTVIITLLQNDQAQFIKIMTYTLTNTLISSVSVGGGGGIPTETVSLNFTKIAWEYHVQKTAGSEAGQKAITWDLSKNAAA